MKEYKSLSDLVIIARVSVILTAVAHSAYCFVFYLFDMQAPMYFKLGEAIFAWAFVVISLFLTRYFNLIIYCVRASLIFSCIVCNALLGVDYGFVTLLILIISAGYIHNFKRSWVPLLLGFIEIMAVCIAAACSFDIVTYQAPQWQQDFLNIFGIIFVAVGVLTYAVLTEQVSNIQQREMEISRQNRKKNLETDKLSGLYNRTTMSEILHRQVDLFNTTSQSELCVALLDLDGFRRVNELYGHKFGDLVIANVSEIIKNIIAPQSGKIYAGRWSGQEFIISAIETSRDSFMNLLEDLRKEISEFTHTDGYHSGSVTISIGVCINQRNKSVDVMLAKADTALYNCKRDGGNKILDITLAKDLG